MNKNERINLYNTYDLYDKIEIYITYIDSWMMAG